MWNHTFKPLYGTAVSTFYRLGKSFAANLKLKHVHRGEKQDSPFFFVYSCACGCKQGTNDPFCNAACRLGDHRRIPGWQSLACSRFSQYTRLADSIVILKCIKADQGGRVHVTVQCIAHAVHVVVIVFASLQSQLLLSLFAAEAAVAPADIEVMGAL